MMPPLRRRCPECGHVGAAREFAVADADGDRFVACPACSHRFAPVDDPKLL